MNVIALEKKLLEQINLFFVSNYSNLELGEDTQYLQGLLEVEVILRAQCISLNIISLKTSPLSAEAKKSYEQYIINLYNICRLLQKIALNKGAPSELVTTANLAKKIFMLEINRGKNRNAYFERHYDQFAAIYNNFFHNIDFITRQELVIGYGESKGECMGLRTAYAYQRLKQQPLGMGLTQRSWDWQKDQNNIHPFLIEEDFSYTSYRNQGELICRQIEKSDYQYFFISINKKTGAGGHSLFVEHNKITDSWHFFDANLGAFTFSNRRSFVLFYNQIHSIIYPEYKKFKLRPIIKLISDNENATYEIIRHNMTRTVLPIYLGALMLELCVVLLLLFAACFPPVFSQLCLASLILGVLGASILVGLGIKIAVQEIARFVESYQLEEASTPPTNPENEEEVKNIYQGLIAKNFQFFSHSPLLKKKELESDDYLREDSVNGRCSQ